MSQFSSLLVAPFPCLAEAFQGFEGTNKGANIIAAACPFCNTMLTDGVKNKEKEDDVALMDIAELVAASMAAGS